MNAAVLYKTIEGERMVMGLYDDTLNHWPVPYETQKVATRHGETFVIASGKTTSPALILLHGAGGNSTMWAGDVGDYSRHYRVYAVDLPGEAGRSSTNRPAWATPAFAEWMEDVLKTLNVERATFTGLSQGAWASLKFAVRWPERVEKLVLMSPGGIVPDRPTFLLRAIGMSLLGTWGMRRFADALFGDQKVPDEVKEIVVKMAKQFKPRVGVLPIFTDDELRRLTMPTLLLGGTKDIARDLNKIEARMRNLVPNLTFRMIPGGGHALVNTTETVLGFLNKEAGF